MPLDFTALAAGGQLVCLVRFPGYGVSTDGRLWTCRKVLSRGQRPAPMSETWVEVPGNPQKHGHRQVSILGRTRLIHRLVLEGFRGPCPRGMEACHQDGNPENNRLDNLRWDTHKANGQDAVRHGTVIGERVWKAKLTEQDVREIFAMRQAGKLHREIAEAKGISLPTVCNILKRRFWKHVAIGE